MNYVYGVSTNKSVTQIAIDYYCSVDIHYIKESPSDPASFKDQPKGDNKDVGKPPSSEEDEVREIPKSSQEKIEQVGVIYFQKNSFLAENICAAYSNEGGD